MIEDYSIDIGLAAGIIYHELSNKKMNLSTLEKHLHEKGYNTTTVLMALGWLAREDKVHICKSNKWSISLK